MPSLIHDVAYTTKCSVCANLHLVPIAGLSPSRDRRRVQSPGTIICFSVLLAALDVGTRGNLLLCIIMHQNDKLDRFVRHPFSLNVGEHRLSHLLSSIEHPVRRATLLMAQRGQRIDAYCAPRRKVAGE